MRTQPTILLIDDEQFVLRAYARLLQHTATVVTAENGCLALELIEDGLCPDVILCDVAMPRLSGVQVLEALRAKHPALARRLLFVTGGALEPETGRRVAASGAPVLLKPVRRSDLVAAIQERLLLRGPPPGQVATDTSRHSRAG